MSWNDFRQISQTETTVGHMPWSFQCVLTYTPLMLLYPTHNEVVGEYNGFTPSVRLSVRVCRMCWPLTLTYICKVIRPWLRKSCLLCSVYSSGWIVCIFSTNYNYHKRVFSLSRFFRIWKFKVLANFWNFSAFTWIFFTVLDGFFPYLAQMITSMRGCVAYYDLWPWPISSRSFGLGLENRVRSVASTVFDGFFPNLVQMITSMRKCVAYDDLRPWPISSRSFYLDFENRVCYAMLSVLDRLLPYLPQIITTIKGCVAC